MRPLIALAMMLLASNVVAATISVPSDAYRYRLAVPRGSGLSGYNTLPWQDVEGGSFTIDENQPFEILDSTEIHLRWGNQEMYSVIGFNWPTFSLPITDDTAIEPLNIYDDGYRRNVKLTTNGNTHIESTSAFYMFVVPEPNSVMLSVLSFIPLLRRRS